MPAYLEADNRHRQDASDMQYHYTTKGLYREIKIMAQKLGMGHNLPDSWQELNETPR
jgi:hypothetical protein